ncbi:hypothetical protein Tco_0913407 [Tanacetum coccineum]
MQSFANRFLRRNVPPFRNNIPSSNYGKGRKEQNGANGICNSKMSFAVQRHNRKDRNEKPQSGRLYHPFYDQIRGRRQKTGIERKVFRWLKEGTIRKFQYPEWVTNTIHVKLENGIWKVQVDYSSLNKVCAKDMYPFSEEGEELALVMEYMYKCFLRLLKENSQIRMAENDEQNTGFHTKEGVYYFTHMPKELKKLSGDTSEDDGKGLFRSKRAKCRSIPGRNSGEKKK